MAPQQETENLPAVAEGKKKSGILKWVLIILGSFVISYAGSLAWIVYVENPAQQEAAVETVAADSPEIEETGESISNKTVAPESEAQPKPENMSETVQQDSNAGQPAQIEQQEQSPEPQPAMRYQEYQPEQEIAGQEPPTTESQKPPKDYKKLAKIYSQMDAGAAAQILARMDDKTVVGILNQMRDRNAAELLTAFSATRAARLSQELSQFPTNNL
ncbi:MAG: hypothetical protein K9N46_07170 [Candidatus Marinimicrobia bacterium]|nr:hypothetical protein [Candidatus Neomarinimicrobiota bacterium]MCF7880502.1 hypothetical protein [Candidatus Neomarinimicrobiota bacterium]